MKIAIVALFLFCGKIAFTQDSPRLDTIQNEMQICFDLEDARDIVRWNEERLSCKDYVNILHTKISIQDEIISNFKQAVSNDSIIQVNTETTVVEIKEHYKSLVKTNAKLSLKLHESESKVKERNKVIAVSVILNVFLSLLLVF